MRAPRCTRRYYHLCGRRARPASQWVVPARRGARSHTCNRHRARARLLAAAAAEGPRVFLRVFLYYILGSLRPVPRSRKNEFENIIMYLVNIDVLRTVPTPAACNAPDYLIYR